MARNRLEPTSCRISPLVPWRRARSRSRPTPNSRDPSGSRSCRTARTERVRPQDGPGWPVSEREEAVELRPGLEQVAAQTQPGTRTARPRRARVTASRGACSRTTRTGRLDSPRPRAGRTDERYVTLMPLALSRTQDALGRIRWTLFGASEHGPARAFWRSFFAAGRWRAAGRGGARGSSAGCSPLAYGETPGNGGRPPSCGPAHPAPGPPRAAPPRLARRTTAALDRAAACWRRTSRSRACAIS